MSLTLYDEFAGWGGSSQGATAVPGVDLVLAANHSAQAVQVHSLNFPAADHYLGDVTKADLTRFPRADLFWASPACPPFSNARGRKQYFDTATEAVLFTDPAETEAERAARVELAKRRALMEEVPRYLRAKADTGAPVLAGVVENVPPARKWDQWTAWLHAIATAAPAGYRTWVIALDSMHAVGVNTARAPQSRGRLFVAYLLASIGRCPDWDKWLRPPAWCPTCDRVVAAVQVWKRPGVDMGTYGRHGQYLYRCPTRHGPWRGTSRPGIVEPFVVPAAAAIDWTLPPGATIGERADPLKPATIARIEAGLRRHAGRPITLDVGGHTFERRPGVRTWSVDGPLTTLTTTTTPTRALAAPAMPGPAGRTWPAEAGTVEAPMPARTTRQTNALPTPPTMVAPLLVPTTGPGRGTAHRLDRPLHTQTARQETALVIPPFIAPLRGGGSRQASRAVDEPLYTFSAQGTHHRHHRRTHPTPAGASPHNHGELGDHNHGELGEFGVHEPGAGAVGGLIASHLNPHAEKGTHPMSCGNTLTVPDSSPFDDWPFSGPEGNHR